MHQTCVAYRDVGQGREQERKLCSLDKDSAIACAIRLVLMHPGGSGCIEIYRSRY